MDVLGPWEVRVDGRSVSIPPGQLRLLLAVLLLSPSESVPIDDLVSSLWPDHPPSRPRETLHTYVTRLRKLLGPELIETTPGGGYRIRLAPERIDLHRFRELVRWSQAANSEDDELRLLRDALQLWRGRPFGDMASTWLDREVLPLLTEEWFTATERRIDLELDQGRHPRLIGELWDLTKRFPTRESLWVRLITALHRSGRRADALEAYQQVRLILDEELGIDPGDQLSLLQRAILLEGSEPKELAGPRELPHDISNFIVRGAELAALDAVHSKVVRGAPTIVAIDGAPGTGKTTLAVHWAHQIAHCFPDGQLFLNLRGYGPGRPLVPATAAATMLRSLGIDGAAVPAGLEERAALLRSTLSGRRVLILLDNARDASQVRPLLPGTDCLVIVTSRNQLRSLSIRDRAHRITVDRLERQQAIELLSTIIGSDKATAEPAAVDRLAKLCDNLPLALAIVAERANRTQLLAEVVSAVEDERARLDLLATGEIDPHTDLRAALSWSYGALRHDAAAMFRMLGLHPANDIGVETAAALAGLTVPVARQCLDQLVAVHLIEERRPDRYEFHDLIRLYATDQAMQHERPADREAAVRRALDWYLHAAVSADSQLLPHRRRDYLSPYSGQRPPPEFRENAEAVAWFDREYESLRSLTTWAAGNGWPGHAWRIVLAMTAYIDTTLAWRDGMELCKVAIRAAEIAQDDVGSGLLAEPGGLHRPEPQRPRQSPAVSAAVARRVHQGRAQLRRDDGPRKPCPGLRRARRPRERGEVRSTGTGAE